MDKLLQNILLIDIETVPQAANWETLNDTWQALWTEKMSKITTAGVPPEESYEQRAGILAEFSKIICISIILQRINIAVCWRRSRWGES